MQAHAICTYRVCVERSACRFTHVLRVTKDLHRLVISQHACDFSVDPRDRPELARPVGLMVRPANPGGAVWLPLRGHPQSKRRLVTHDEPRRHGGTEQTRSSSCPWLRSSM